METVRQYQELETALELLEADLKFVRVLAAQLATKVRKDNKPAIESERLRLLAHAIMRCAELGLLKKRKAP
jgi:hypothetical protein